MKKRTSQNALFKEIYCEYKNEIYKFLFVKTKGNKETAEDLCEDTFTVLLNRLYGDESFTKPRAFLYKTANNLFLKQCEKDKKENLIYEKNTAEYEIHKEFSLELLPEDFDYAALAEKLVNKLSESEQELYNLRYKEKKSIEECAKIQNTTFSSEAMRLSRLKKKITKAVKETIKNEESEVRKTWLKLM